MPLETRPVFTSTSIATFRRWAWAACLLAYVGVFGLSIFAGASDIWAVGKAAAVTLALAVASRIGLGLAARARLAEAPLPPPQPIMADDALGLLGPDTPPDLLSV